MVYDEMDSALGLSWMKPWHLLVLFTVAFNTFGCASSPDKEEPLSQKDNVKVTKLPPTIEKRVFDKGLRPVDAVLESHNQYANTNWYFRTKPRFDFDILETKSEKGKTNVKLLIKAIDLQLSLSIIIWLPQGANQEVLAHEDGHVDICKRLYKTADAPARQAAELVVGKTFEGSGVNVQEACQVALNKASLDISAYYGEKTVSVVNRVSQYYDKLAPQHPEPKYVSSTLDAAFQLYDRVSKAGGELEDAFPKTEKI